MRIVFLNDQFLSEDKALIPIGDRGFLFGDGVFSTLRVSEGIVENAALHLNRLERDAHALQITFPAIKEEWLRDLILHNNACSGAWRLKIIITGGSSPGLFLAPRSNGILLMTLSPCREISNQAQCLTLFPDPIHHPSAQIKSLSYLDRLFVKGYAREKGYDDAVVTGSNRELLETSFSNLFWCAGNDVFAPDPKLPLLSGVTIRVVQEAIDKLGMKWRFVCQPLEEVHENAHFFLCNSLQEIRSISQVGSRFFKVDLNLARRLKKTYRECAKKYALDCL